MSATRMTEGGALAMRYAVWLREEIGKIPEREDGSVTHRELYEAVTRALSRFLDYVESELQESRS